MAMNIPPDLDCKELIVCVLGNFACFFLLIFCRLLIFEKNFQKIILFISLESNSFDLYQAEVLSTFCKGYQ